MPILSMRKSFHYRCKNCRRRKTFKRQVHISHKEQPACDCGCRDWRPDTYRDNTEHKKTKCKCLGYHFPHRKGSLHCEHFKGDLEDQAERYGYSPTDTLTFIDEEKPVTIDTDFDNLPF